MGCILFYRETLCREYPSLLLRFPLALWVKLVIRD